jgi:hypothetical protein
MTRSDLQVGFKGLTSRSDLQVRPSSLTITTQNGRRFLGAARYLIFAFQYNTGLDQGGSRR